jgi:alpha-ketoglutaric semialdehyde dehydrogenase
MTPTSTQAAVYRNHIGGAWAPSSSEKTVANVNPADGRDVLGLVPQSSADEARAAVAAARDAFPSWRDTPAPKRGAVLFRAMALLDQEKEAVARLLTREEGKTLGEALGEVQRAINVLEFTAAEGRRLGGHTVPSELPRNFCYTLRQPLGVVACITPWNFPVAIPVWKVAPALVCGNTVVLKPATLTPACATTLVSIFERAGLPPGVLNLVLGSGSVAGGALLDDPDVRAVSFTGSTDVGTAVYARGAGRLARVQCEMGGKNPVVVMGDADLELAVEATAQGAFGSTGQRCTATSRVIVEDRVADAFVERLAARAARIRVGSGLEGADMGPAVDATQLETDLRYVDIGREEGARLVQGGERITGGDLDHGHFLRPAIFDHVKTSMRIAQEEIFGPVVSVIRVAGFEAALEAANAVRYGLAASIFTSDATTSFRFVDGIEAGIVHVNSGTPGGEAQLPFGGSKATGVGPREQGTTALDFYSEIKTVYVDYTGQSRRTSVY